MVEETAAAPEQPADGWEWGVLEIMGHRSHAGRFREEERFGAKFVRIDVPIDGDPSKGWTTHLYGAAAVFSLRYSDEATVMKANQPYVSPYRLSYREDLERTADEPAAVALNEILDGAKVVVEREPEDLETVGEDAGPELFDHNEHGD